MSEKTQTVKRTYYVCDQCGYAIESCKTESEVAEKHIVLTVRGTTYHFHGNAFPHKGEHGIDLPPWEETKACFGRWMIASKHKETFHAKGSTSS